MLSKQILMEVYIAFIGNINHITGGFWPLPLYCSYDIDVVNHHNILTLPSYIFADNINKVRQDKVLFKYTQYGGIKSIVLLEEKSYPYYFYQGVSVSLYSLIVDIKFVTSGYFYPKHNRLSQSDPGKRLRLSEPFIPPGFDEITSRLSEIPKRSSVRDKNILVRKSRYHLSRGSRRPWF